MNNMDNIKLTSTEAYLVAQLKEKLNISHIPIYRNGHLIRITDIPDDEIYNNRQYAYSAKIFISDEYIYNFNDIESIKSLEIPKFNSLSGMPDVTSDLSYILKMQACAENNITKSFFFILKVYELMNGSPIGWQRRDYMMLIERLWKNGLISEADQLENIMNNELIVFDHCKIFTKKLKETFNTAKELNTDLIISSHHSDTCKECSILQDRVYSISGKSKKYPPLPKQVLKYGNFHKGCRHIFFTFHDISSIFKVESNGKIYTDPIAYSNRPYVDMRTPEEISRYTHFVLKRQNDKDFEQAKREYYQYKFSGIDEKPISFSKYLKKINFVRITK